MSQPTKREVEALKRGQQAERLRRKGTLQKWNDYIGFLTSKAVGLVASFVGGSEVLAPEYLDIALQNPEWVAMAGLSFLAGKVIMSPIVKLVESYREISEATE